MKRFIYLSLVFLCHFSSAQTGYLQVFSSGGSKQATNGTITLQGTIGEAVMYATGSNYTQGFQQPIYIYSCDTLAQFNNGLDSTICLNDSYDLELKYTYTTIEWWSKEQNTLLSNDALYAYPTDAAIQDSVFAIVIEGACTDTSKVLGVDVIAFDTALVVTDTILCKDGLEELSTSDEYNIAWFLDDQEVGTTNTYDASTGGEYFFTKSYKHCSENSRKEKIRFIDLTTEGIDDITTCSNDTTLTLQTDIPEITWTNVDQGGTTQSGLTYQIIEGGNYQIEYKDNKCTHVDDFLVTMESIDFDILDVSTCSVDTLLESPIIGGATYQWNLLDGQKAGTVSGNNYQAVSSGKYELAITQNGCISRDTTLVSFDGIDYTFPSSTLTSCKNDTTLQITGLTNVVYDWKKQGTTIGSANAVTLNESTSYSLNLSNATCSNDYNFTFENFAPNGFTIQSNSTDLCLSTNPLSLWVDATNPYTYQWYWNDKKIQGATNDTYDVIISGNYSIRVANEKCNTSLSPISITSALSDIEILENSGSLAPNYTGSKHQWYVEIQGENYAIVGATTALYKPLYNGNYKIDITSGICKGMSDVYVMNNTNFSDVQRYAQFNDKGEVILTKKPTIRLYPNPSLGKFTIEHNDQLAEKTITVYDLLGNVVFTSITQKAILEVNLNHLPKGLYWVEVQSSQETFTQKIVLQ